MDQLDLLKKRWDDANDSFPKYSKKQLQLIIAKRSTSIVKWLLIIAIIEFLVFSGINLLPGVSAQNEQAKMILGEILYHTAYIVHYAVILWFIYRFYLNYTRINTTQPAKSLMENILKTRKTMKWYIWYNLSYMVIFGMVFSSLMFYKDPNIVAAMEQAKQQTSSTVVTLIYMVMILIMLLVMAGLLYGLYSLIYGILLKRLKNNYKELKKMEV
jgi:hypothetical protein